jgi:hypothetical protein
MAKSIFKQLTIIFLTGLVFTFITSSPILANPPVTNIRNQILPGFLQGDLGSFITRLISIALVIGVIATLLLLIYGGISWVTSAGDKSKLESARNIITNALIGLAILAAAWGIWLLAINFLGLGNLEGLNIGSSTTPTQSNPTQRPNYRDVDPNIYRQMD